MRGMFIVDFTSTEGNISEDVYNYDILFLVMMMIMRPISPYLLRTTRPRLKAKKIQNDFNAVESRICCCITSFDVFKVQRQFMFVVLEVH